MIFLVRGSFWRSVISFRPSLWLCDSVANPLFSQTGLDAFGEGFEVADALHFVVRGFDVEVIFDAREEFQSLQAVDAQLLEKVVLRRKSSRGQFEMRSSQIQHFPSGLFQCWHDPNNLAFPRTEEKLRSCPLSNHRDRLAVMGDNPSGKLAVDVAYAVKLLLLIKRIVGSRQQLFR